MSDFAPRRVAVADGLRTPFCRAGAEYAELSNLDLLSAVLGAPGKRHDLRRDGIDEVWAGAVNSHAKDWNLAREAVLSAGLAPDTPAVTLTQACATSLQAAGVLAAKIATGEIDSGIAAGSDTASDLPIVFDRRFAQRLIRTQRARSLRERLAQWRGFRLRELLPVAPSPAEPRTGLSMGQHTERMAREWGITRAEQDAFAADSHRKALAARAAGWFDAELVPCAGVVSDRLPRAGSDAEQLARLRPAFAPDGTLTAGNASALTDGAAAVLLCEARTAARRGLPVLAHWVAQQSAAVDFVAGEGLLLAPALAVGRLLKRLGLGFADFDVIELHEAFAAQVLCTLAAWRSADWCRARLGLEAALGEPDPARLNACGSSLALGHPFAATGARVLLSAARRLAAGGGRRALLAVCTAGGMGVAVVLERPHAG